MTRKIRLPIVLLGAPRSGTTLLGKLFAAHPDVAYWEEPRPIWTQGNSWRSDDRLDASHLTEGIAQQIDGVFGRFVLRSGRTRFAEKTPSNLLRIPFIYALYPDVRFIHLVRDPRSVVASMRGMLAKSPDARRVLSRVWETPLGGWPAQIALAFRGMVEPLWRGGRKRFWGPRPPGWQSWIGLPEEIRLAKQWNGLVETGVTELGRLPKETSMVIRYEDLVRDPASSLDLLYDFAGLSREADTLAKAVALVRHPANRSIHGGLTVEQASQVTRETAPLLSTLGYPA
ncbi:MAG: sulfotransferase [Verrucomicrobiales bacterium]|nr:sulfotransferase [Verrucomicrobiae bacterium]MCP5552323.1 sulfotransferase [Akkermansiaceae bacterium]HRX54360.1 sulfotransferase [Verrucomicrobiales bacterium]